MSWMHCWPDSVPDRILNLLVWFGWVYPMYWDRVPTITTKFMHRNNESICEKFWLYYECDINWICRTYENLTEKKRQANKIKVLLSVCTNNQETIFHWNPFQFLFMNDKMQVFFYYLFFCFAVVISFHPNRSCLARTWNLDFVLRKIELLFDEKTDFEQKKNAIKMVNR